MAAPPALINNSGYPLLMIEIISFDNIQLPPTIHHCMAEFSCHLSKITYPSYEFFWLKFRALIGL
jgi:hypothetical protein